VNQSEMGRAYAAADCLVWRALEAGAAVNEALATGCLARQRRPAAR
jgi:hypothetical protein